MRQVSSSDQRAMRAELRIFLNKWFCKCGSPELAAASLLRLLNLTPFYDHRPDVERFFHDDAGLEHLVLYFLGTLGLIEHGGSVGGAWITPRGETVQEALAHEEVDGFIALFVDYCRAGFDADDVAHTDGSCPCLEEPCDK